MDYQQIKHIITHIEDTGITDAEKHEAIKTICDGNIDYLTRDDLQRALSWYWSDVSFARAIQKLKMIRLENRLKHLLSSEFIRSFDEVSYPSGTYKRDIKEADMQGDINGVVEKLIEVLPGVVNTLVETIPVVVEKIISEGGVTSKINEQDQHNN